MSERPPVNYLLAEVEELERRLAAERQRADAAEAALDRVATLADQWDIHTPPVSVYLVELARELRAAMAGETVR